MISEIFKWYEHDFGGRRGILDFIVDYLNDDRVRDFIRDNYSALSIEYLHYDWNLNR